MGGAKKCRCHSPPFEPIFIGLLSGLATEHRIPAGSVVDAGAHDGTFTCHFATLLPNSTVFYAVEPLRRWFTVLRQTFEHCPGSVVTSHFGLGDKRARFDPGKGAATWDAVGDAFAGYREVGSSVVTGRHEEESQEAFDVEVLDELFGPSGAWSGTPLGMLHLDVEGGELNALRGALSTVRRHLPVLTLELHVHQDAEYSRRLLELADTLGYDTFLVEEICGLRADCRNLLCIPRARHAEFRGSPTLDLVTASRKLFQVDATSLPSHAYPCCQPNGECCRSRRRCCAKEDVARWLRDARRAYDETGRLGGGGARDPTLYAPTVFLHQPMLKWPGPAPGTALYNASAA